MGPRKSGRGMGGIDGANEVMASGAGQVPLSSNWFGVKPEWCAGLVFTWAFFGLVAVGSGAPWAQ